MLAFREEIIRFLQVYMEFTGKLETILRLTVDLFDSIVPLKTISTLVLLRVVHGLQQKVSPACLFYRHGCTKHICF